MLLLSLTKIVIISDAASIKCPALIIAGVPLELQSTAAYGIQMSLAEALEVLTASVGRAVAFPAMACCLCIYFIESMHFAWNNRLQDLPRPKAALYARHFFLIAGHCATVPAESGRALCHELHT